MSDITRSLGSGEKIIYRTKLHWIIFFWPAFFMALTIFVALFPDDEFSATWELFFLIGCLLGFRAFLRRACSKFTITDQRIILKAGLLRCQYVDLYLDSVSGVQAEQSLWGGMLGYGTVTATSHGKKETFSKISRPLEFREKVREIKQNKEDVK